MRTTTKIVLTGAFLAGVFAAHSAQKLTKQFLNVKGEKPPGYTHVVTSAPGKMIFISGRGGADAEGKLSPDFATQARNAFEDLKRCLALAGADFKDVVKINYYLKDISSVAVLRQIRAQYLDAGHPPAATLVQVGLSGGLLLEVEAIAMVPE